jgi:CheY-like chemotaxis protein
MNAFGPYIIYFLLPFFAMLGVLLVWPFLPSLFSFRKTRKCLLVVDDYGAPLADIQNYFNNYQKDYEVIIASSVEKAKETLEEHSPDHAAIDLMLGDEHNREDIDVDYRGLEIIEFIIRNNITTKPIILSARSWEEVENKIKEKFPNSSIQDDLRDNYVYKGTSDAGGYVGVLLNTLRRLEKVKEQNKS